MRTSLAEKLRILRAQRGFAQTEAAEKIGVDRHTLRRLERGVGEPRYPTLRKIATAYDIPVEELIGEPTLPGKASTPSTSGFETQRVSDEEMSLLGSFFKDSAEALVNLESKLWGQIELEDVDLTYVQNAEEVEQTYWKSHGPTLWKMSGEEADARDLMYAALDGLRATIDQAYNTFARVLTQRLHTLNPEEREVAEAQLAKVIDLQGYRAERERAERQRASRSTQASSSSPAAS